MRIKKDIYYDVVSVYSGDKHEKKLLHYFSLQPLQLLPAQR